MLGWGAGNGGYGRLGHNIQQDEFTPKKVQALTGRMPVAHNSIVRLFGKSIFFLAKRSRYSCLKQLTMFTYYVSENLSFCVEYEHFFGGYQGFLSVLIKELLRNASGAGKAFHLWLLISLFSWQPMRPGKLIIKNVDNSLIYWQ